MGMDYPVLFDRVCRHLDSLGIPFSLECGQSIDQDAIIVFEKSMGIRLPEELTNFYRDIGNGCTLTWISDPENDSAPFANLDIRSIESLGYNYQSWREGFLYTSDQAEEYGFPYTKNPELAKQTAARMWNWLPVISDNSDDFCIDLSEPGCPVIFNKGDWMDGGTGHNGHPVAPNFRQFLEDWSKVCFQFPKSLYWPDCLRPDGGVKWDGEQFHMTSI